MGCFKAVLDKVKKDVQKKMGNMPAFKVDEKFARMTEERSSKKSFSDLMVPDWMEDPRVAMDFTQGIGRIVHDKEEIEQIKREPKQTSPKIRYEKYESFPKEALEHGVHQTQKYYHGELERLAAEKMLLETKINGSWLLRDSRARTNCLTLSYLYEGRVYHKYVSAASHFDKTTRQRIYVATLDQTLAFYDVHSLTEFYRLNKGNTMMCKLAASVKNESQRDSSPRRFTSSKSTKPSKPVVINLQTSKCLTSPQSTDSIKSQNSIVGFFSKTIQKSKQALKPKKLSWANGNDPAAVASTSKESGLAIATLKPEHSLESPPSSSITEASSSGVSLSGGLTSLEIPPASSQVHSSTSPSSDLSSSSLNAPQA